MKSLKEYKQLWEQKSKAIEIIEALREEIHAKMIERVESDFKNGRITEENFIKRKKALLKQQKTRAKQLDYYQKDYLKLRLEKLEIGNIIKSIQNSDSKES